MSTLKVYIPKEGDPTYDPDTKIVHRGDTVEFILDDRTDVVQVVFDDGCPFQDSNITLDGSSLTNFQQSRIVEETASARLYPFTAQPVPPTGFHGGGAEQAGTVHGDLDVSSDSPPKD